MVKQLSQPQAIQAGSMGKKYFFNVSTKVSIFHQIQSTDTGSNVSHSDIVPININYNLMMIEERNQGLVDRFAQYFQGHIMSSCH